MGIVLSIFAAFISLKGMLNKILRIKEDLCLDFLENIQVLVGNSHYLFIYYVWRSFFGGSKTTQVNKSTSKDNL